MSRRALLVEDDPLGGLLLCDMLRALGWEVDGPKARLAEGLAAARSGGYGLAVLDVNLAGEMCFPIAELLASRGIPYVFTTGYGRDGLDLATRSGRVLTKPFAQQELGAVIEAVLPGAGQAEPGA